MKPCRKIPLPEDVPVLKVNPHIMEIYGISETTAYDAIRRGDIPSIRVGRRIVCPTASVRKALGLDEPEEPVAS